MRIFLLLFLIFLFFPASVFGHTFGQPPFFKINGVYSNLYPVPASSVEGFILPQDLAVDNFLVNQDLEFEFDQSKMPAPKEVIDQTNFFWDFGDGARGAGLKNNHRYSKPGSYTLSIEAQLKTDPKPQLIQSVFFNILSSKDYKLPKAIIRANGKVSSDPLTDIIKTEFTKPVELDGGTSISGSGKIVSYQWDLGDTNSSTKMALTHKYEPQLNQVFPVLRVKDENGFISDSFIEIENGLEFNQNPAGFISENLEPNRLINDSNPVIKVLTYAVAAILSFVTIYFVIKLLRNFLKKNKP